MNKRLDELKQEIKFRPASIVVEFNSQSEYEKAVDLYCRLLNRRNPYGGKRPYPSPTPFAVGDYKEVELRLEFANTGALANKVEVYWEIPQGSLEEIHDALSDENYSRIEPRPGTDLPPDDNETRRILFKDYSGNLVGLITNPPFPRGDRFKWLELLLTSLISLFLGLAFAPKLTALFKALRKSNH
ncbi:hypothetical protein [Hymenobacter cavernae]|uniref:VOC domain-containing protein n=1 Tax=Hymenobacter cavernae TaxID=2044852 RepID=A0ABQ1UU97_9BACT|nr:hypothetical protein [Hymenobacter cavernae]GGF26950.1 hypothetical protein GCM10011383_43130 [Hymenobacter cavernae]